MKIKINPKKGLLPRKPIQKYLRYGIIITITILILFSAFTTIQAYQQPTQEEQTITTLSYYHSTTYDYTVNLFPNTIYNKTELKPGEGTLFKKLIDHINGSLTHTFSLDTEATISGSYTLQAKIQTSQWTKTYTLYPQTSFNATSTTHTFTITFPIDLAYYEQIVQDINTETGITSTNPTLIITSQINIIAQTPQGPVFSSIIPTMEIPLSGRVIEIPDTLSDYKSGRLTDTQIISYPEVTEQQNLWTWITILLIIPLIITIIFTKSKTPTTSKIEKQYQKINKKYGEWIIEAQTNPATGQKTRIIPLSGIEDLSKLSEEIGKPIIHYQTTNEHKHETHIYYILDQETLYRYILQEETNT